MTYRFHRLLQPSMRRVLSLAALLSFALPVAAGTVTGIVKESGGQGLAGVTVTIDQQAAKKGTTNSSGVYSILNVSATTTTVTATKVGYVSQTTGAMAVPATGTLTVPDILLVQAPTITGTVVSSIDQTPISGATVKVTGTTVSTTSSSSGTFTLYPAAGTYTLTVSKTGWQTQTTPSLTTANGQPANAGSISLIPFGTLSGTVVSSLDGSPVVGATVKLTGTTATSTTSATGAFTFSQPAGSYTLTITKTGWQTLTTASFTVAAGQTTGTGAIALTPFGTIAGTIVSSLDGTPVAGATVNSSGTAATVTTGATGTFTIYEPTGAYTLTVKKTGWQTVITPSLAVTNGQTTNAGTIALTKMGTISGTVVNAITGAPVSGATVKVTGTSISDATDANGVFTIYQLTGTYTLTVTRSGYQSATTGSLSVTNGQTTDTGAISLNPLATVTGTVLGSLGGGPVPGATVKVTGGTGSTTTAADGNFSLVQAPGSVTLTISKVGWQSLRSPTVVLLNGQTTNAGALSLTPLGLITGTVVDAVSGTPVAGAAINSSGSSPNVTTQANGTFTLYELTGSYTLTVSKAGYQTVTMPSISATNGQTTSTGPIALTQLGAITGIVVSTWDGSPIRGATVKAAGSTARATTNASGVFTLYIASGTYTLTASRSGFDPATIAPLSVTNGQTTDAGTISLAPRVPPAGTITGRVLEPGFEGPPPVEGATVDAGGGNTALTDSSGRFTHDLPAGTYSLTVSKSGYRTATAGPFTVTNGQTLDVGTITLIPVAQVTGRISDAVSGQLLPGVLVTLHSDPTISTSTDALGVFNLVNVPETHQVFDLTKTGYVAQPVGADILPGTNDLGLIRLIAGAGIAVAGPIGQDTTWNLAGSPYYVVSTVEADATLTIAPGVVVMFQPGTGLTVTYGKLLAVGTSSNPITFSAVGPNPSPGSWDGIQLFNSPVPGNQISYATIAHAGGGTRTAALSVVTATIIDHVSVSDSASGGIEICCSDNLAPVLLSNVTVVNNAGIGINLFSGGKASISGATIQNNGDYAIGAEANTNLVALSNLTASGNGGGAKNGVGYRGGTISSNEAWHAGPTWALLGSTTVSSGSTLTLDPGLIVKVDSDVSLTVSGTLSAAGTSASPITFTSSSGTPSPGAWRGISFTSASSGSSQLSYVNISYAGSWGGGAVWVLQPLSFDNVAVSYSSSSGIYVTGVTGSTATLTLSNSTLSNNALYGLNLVSGGGASLSTVSLTNNVSYAIGAEANTRVLGLSNLTVAGNGGGTKNAIGYRGGTITGSETWRAGLPWFITAPAAVGSYYGNHNPPPTLTVGPGATVKFFPTVGLTVFDVLQAVGTGASPVTFTTAVNPPAPGSWAYLEFSMVPGVPPSKVGYATISYAGDTQFNGIVTAIVAHGGTAVFDHVTVTESAGFALLVPYTAAVTVTNSSFVADRFGVSGWGTSQVTGLFNYWDSASGPSGSGPGTGASVGSSVPFEPWLTAPASDPLFFTSVTQLNQTFNPTIWATSRLSFEASISGTWKVSILDSQGSPLRTLGGTGATGTAAWDGANEAGVLQPNGTYFYLLESTDTGGHVAAPVKGRIYIDTTKGNFSVTQSAYELNAGAGGTLTYTSVVPFPMVETLIIKNQAGQTVRTLFNGQRVAADTYADIWDGKNDLGVPVPDGPYFEVATANDGTHPVITWDLTNQFVTAPTRYEVGPFPVAPWDPFNNRPLTITYNLPDPARTSVEVTRSAGAVPTGTCDPGDICIVMDRYEESGDHTVTWAGVDASDVYRPDMKGIGYWSRRDNFSKNAVVLFGKNPRITNLAVTPSYYDPEKGDQAVNFNLTTYHNQPANVTITIKNQTSLAILKTIILTNQAPGQVSTSWNGHADGNGYPVIPGNYTVTVSVSDSLGQSAVEKILTVIGYY